MTQGSIYVTHTFCKICLILFIEKELKTPPFSVSFEHIY